MSASTLGKWAALVTSFIVVFAIAKPIGAMLGRSTYERFSAGQSTGSLEELQRFAADELSKQLPKRVNNQATLNSAISVGAQLIYSYTVDAYYNDIDKTVFRNAMQKMLVHNVCGEKNMRSMMERGAGYQYVYLSQEGLRIDSFGLTKADCSRN